jgi:hypothetical protein
VDERGRLRPIERVVQRLAASGLGTPEIAWRLRRTPGYVERVMAMAALPDRTGPGPGRADGLRPLERVVLRARAEGVDVREIAARHRRTPAFVERVIAMAQLKLDAA